MNDKDIQSRDEQQSGECNNSTATKVGHFIGMALGVTISGCTMALLIALTAKLIFKLF